MAKFQGMSDADKLNDMQILNRALFFENRVFGLITSRPTN